MSDGARTGVPCATVVPTRDGAPRAVIDEQLVDLEWFVAHDRTMDSWERV